MTYDETAAVLGLLAIEYRNEVIDEPRIELWSELFKDVAFDDAKAAVLAWFQDGEKGRFFPRPAELRGLVRATQPKLDSKLYKRYAELRRIYQTALLSEQDERELSRIEQRLGIAKSVNRPSSLEAIPA